MGWTQSSDGSLSVLKTKIHENWLQSVTNFKHRKFLTLCSINSLTIIEWRHYSNNSLSAVTETISQRSLKKNELMDFINYFFLKNFNMNLFMCLYLEIDSSRVLSSDSGSALMIVSFSVKHRSRFLVPLVYGWALQAIDHLRS